MLKLRKVHKDHKVEIVEDATVRYDFVNIAPWSHRLFCQNANSLRLHILNPDCTILSRLPFEELSCTTSSNTNSSFLIIVPMLPLVRLPSFCPLTPLRSDPWYWYPFERVCCVRWRCAFENSAFRAGMEAHHMPTFTSTIDHVFMGTDA
jgi:hypothetical protein